jgi:hypothetical protein
MKASQKTIEEMLAQLCTKEEESKYFRSKSFELLQRISVYYNQYYLVGKSIKVTIIVIPSDDNMYMVLSYIQFNPNVTNIEDKLHYISCGVYNIDDQLFLIVTSSEEDILEKVAMTKDYISAYISCI